MTPTRSGPPGAVLALALLASCQSSHGGTETRPALDSDPAATGLVVVDVRMEFRTRFDHVPLKLESGSVVSVDTGTRWTAHARDGLLLFDGLPPGIYLVTHVRSEPWEVEGQLGNVTYTDEARRNLDLPRRAGFEFIVEPGRMTFVGPMIARNGRGRTDVLVDTLEDSTAEGRALRKVLEMFPDSPWAPIVRERLDELRG